MVAAPQLGAFTAIGPVPGPSPDAHVRTPAFDDLYYVKNHSLLLDVLILLKTVRVVLLGEGAR